jgi:hypothetical protein
MSDRVSFTVLSPQNRNLLIGLVGVLALVFAFVGSNVAANHEPEPHDLPVGIVGSPQVADQVVGQLELSAPGAFKVRAYGSPAAARSAILHRDVYGAFQAGPRPSLLVASAASLAAESVLQRAFQAATRAQGETLAVRDVVALPRSDSGGATAFSALLSLTIAGTLGSSIMYMVTQHRPLAVHLAAVVALAIGSGLVAALSTNVVVGAFPDHFLGVWGMATLFVLAIGLPIAAFQQLFGLPGTAIPLIVFIVVGSPSSGGGTAPELLPGFWRAVSQLLPPGAGTTAMRDVVYFSGHGAASALLVLGIYAILGVIGAIAVHSLRARAEATTAST